MTNQPLCPFCASSLVCQVSQGKPYWFCLHCHQEVPYAFCDNVKETELMKNENHYQTILRSDIDELTKLPNYARFSENLNQEWRRMLRENKYLSLILCAIELNRNYNSEKTLLVKIAETIDNSVHRPGDLVARYRHHEFAVLLPNTDFQGATRVTERISLSLLNLLLENEEQIFNKYGQFRLGIAALIPPPKMTFDLLIIKAEQSLAKTINN